MIPAPSNFNAANAALQKTPIFLITIAGYSRVFTNYATGISGQYPWIEAIEDLTIQISELDGGSNIGEFKFQVQDVGFAITADFPGFTFEGKAVTLQTGFFGMSQADFVQLWTGVVDVVSSANGNASYAFTCIDNQQLLSKVIYQVADDGFSTDSNHHKILNAHPLDIFTDVLLNEVGYPASSINTAKINGYRDGLFTSLQFAFEIDSPPVAKDFLEQQILKPLGGYMFTNAQGQIDVSFFYKDYRIAVQAGCMIAAWVDGTGQLLQAPFAPGNDLTVKAPSGAVYLQLGVNDHFYSDNLQSGGGWTIDVNGTVVTVGPFTGPWSLAGGLNSAYTYFDASTTAPIRVSVTPGTAYRIAYISGMVSLHGANLRGPTGLEPSIGLPNPNSPGVYAKQPFTGPVAALTLNDNLMSEIPNASQVALINVVSFRFDKSTGGTSGSTNYAAESVQQYAPSISLYGQYGQQIIESDGMRSGLQGVFLAEQTSHILFLRYGLKNLRFEEVDLLWTACLAEPGDIVALTSAFVPDRQAGVMGVSNRLFEVLDRTWDFTNGVVKLALIDANYLSQIGTFLITPDSEGSYTAVSAADKAKYMFMSSDSDQYSDTSPANVLG
jgi:hypothetical protein